MFRISVLGCLFIIIVLFQQSSAYSWGWFSKTTSSTTGDSSTLRVSEGFVAEFSMEIVSSRTGVQIIEKAKQKMVSATSCWRNAYGSLFAGCSDIMSDKEKQSRFAWQLSDCFQRDSGKPAFTYCDTKGPMVKCLKNLDDSAHAVYLAFYLETNSICHQLQADVFKRETERLVNDLKETAQFAEEKIKHIGGRSDQILENSKQIHNSLGSIDSRIDKVAQTSKEVEEQIDVVLNYSKIIFEHAKEIATSQSELQGEQVDLRQRVEAGMTMLHNSYKNLGQDIEKLRNEAVEIEREISEVGDKMSLKMQSLQDRADDIGIVAGISLDKQKQLLDGQSTALEGLNILTKFQSQALEESRAALQTLVEFGQKQQEELIKKQEQLQRAHDHLVENSRYILEAQEAFESKQANMFMALEKLFSLHNSILQESQMIKSFCFYFFAIIIVYMFTSTKQTYCVRARLYLGLCGTFIAELAILRLCNDLDQQSWLASRISLARLSYLVLASVQILFSIFTYRDYEVLNHRMLQTLMDKINMFEKRKLFEADTGSDISLSAWIDKDVPEEDCYDPDYRMKEVVAENSVSTTSSERRYNLRPRFR